MEKKLVQEKILRKLMAMKPHKWGNSHTEEKNLVKSFPAHLRGTKVVDKAIKELYQLDFLIRLKKTGEWHVSLNVRNPKRISKHTRNSFRISKCPRKKEEIYRFLGIPPRL